MGQAAAASTGGGLAGAASAAMPWVSLGLGAANIGMSLVEASKQKELQRAVDRQAEKSAAEQERLLSQNFFEEMQLPMGVYDKEFNANTAAQQQALSALTEGDPRLLLGGVGKVQGVTVDANANASDRAAEKLYNLGLTQAGAAERTSGKLAALEGQRLAGAQEASAAAQMAKLQAQQKAIGAGGDLIKGLGGLIPEYSDTTSITNGTGSDVFNKYMKYQQPATSQLGVSQLPAAPFAPSVIGQSAFNPFAAVSTISPIQNSLPQFSFNPKRL